MKKILFLIFSLFTLNANAGFYTGNEIKQRLEKWEQSPDSDSFLGFGYVIGVLDAFGGLSLCPDSHVTGGQVEAIVLKYMRDHPESLNLNADVIIFRALSPLWPCKANTQDPAPAAESATPNKPKKRTNKQSPSNESPF